MDGIDCWVFVKYFLSFLNGLMFVYLINEFCYFDVGMWVILCVNFGDLSMCKVYNLIMYLFGIISFNCMLFWIDWILGRI